MATTTNYGWTTPDDTALVKDGAAAIRTLGSSIDTTTKALNPSTTLGDIEYRSSTANTNTRLAIGTSGQVLTVAAGVPSWANGFANPLTTTGDIIYSSSGSTPARLGIGTAAQVLKVNAGATAPEWGAAPSASSSFSLLSTTTLSTGSEYSITGLSGYDKFMVVYENVSSSNASRFEIRLNNDSTAAGRYRYWGADSYTASSTTGVLVENFSQSTAYFPLGITNSAASIMSGGFIITGGNGTGFKQIQTINAVTAVAGADSYLLTGLYEGTSVISSLQFRCFSGNFDGGTVRIYGSVA